MNARKFAPKECVVCGLTFDPASPTARYCPECKPAVRRAQKREWHRSEKGRAADHRYAQTDAYAATQRRYLATYKGRAAVSRKSRNWRTTHPDAVRAQKQLRRARLMEATVETFVDTEIFERDNWTCGICREAIDPALSYPDPMSVSLDHVVPLAQGGSHGRSNVQASHLVCNLRKGARPHEGRAQ